jgi:hypothetical protein
MDAQIIIQIQIQIYTKNNRESGCYRQYSPNAIKDIVLQREFNDIAFNEESSFIPKLFTLRKGNKKQLADLGVYNSIDYPNLYESSDKNLVEIVGGYDFANYNPIYGYDIYKYI